MSDRMAEQNTETGSQKAAEVSQPDRVHLERGQPGVGHLSTEQRLTARFRKGDLVRWNALALHGSDRDSWIVEGLEVKDDTLFPIYRVRKGNQLGSAVQPELEPQPPAVMPPPDWRIASQEALALLKPFYECDPDVRRWVDKFERSLTS